ncbi:Stk1 family PASTA domain-containing Ser/Thr kinase [Brevibacterium litoralis]|uniref:Stk1 family PASTA domain-containing Ser/Thr kinase n=1 Tax=Brevibacterium litoralis TaxID=3138935 RepID=UPI0032EB370E
MTEPRLLSGRYEVRGLLGRGGMAEVHEGLDTRLGRRVAIKLLRSDLARDPSFEARIKREAQSAAGLNHPGIVAVYDSGEQVMEESGGSEVRLPFIVMEYVEGDTLRSVLNDHGSLTVQESLDVIAGVLAPLDYSHRNGIVHRDIKPANVMLTPAGDIKVMDFGIARALEDTGQLTQTQSVVGTAQYLSPEQARGEVVDARSDLYSTACMLYELLAGRTPFTGDSQLAIAYQHVGEKPRPASDFNPDVPAAVDRLLAHALEKSREDRYQDARTFRNDVLAVRDGRPLSIDDEATRAMGAVPPAAAAGAGAIGVASAGVQGSGPAAAQAPATGAVPVGAAGEQGASGVEPGLMTGMVATVPDEGQIDEARRARRRRGWFAVGAALLALVLTGMGLWIYQMSRPAEVTHFELADLSNRTADDAEAYLLDVGLSVDREEVASDDVPNGQVVDTDPAAGSDVSAGSVVQLNVSTGPDNVDVPDVEGETESRARQLINDSGLVAGSNQEENSPDVEKGVVLETKPGSGTNLAIGTTVDLVLSSGQVTVPDVMGNDEESACATLEGDSYQLTCSTTEEETDEAEPGTVIDQSTDGGEDVDQGSTITLTIAKEKPTPTPTPTPTPEPTPQPTQSTGNGNGNDGGGNGGPGNGNQGDGNGNASNTGSPWEDWDIEDLEPLG